MFKEIVLTAIWCIIGSGVALLAMPGIAGIVGAIVAPIVIIIYTVTEYRDEYK